jgi:hypothetical protein
MEYDNNPFIIASRAYSLHACRRAQESGSRSQWRSNRVYACRPESPSNLRFLRQSGRDVVEEGSANGDERRGEGQWSGDRMHWILSFGWWHGGFAEQQHTCGWFVRFLIRLSSCPSDSEFVLTTPKRKSIAPSAALDGRCSACYSLKLF